MLLRSIICLSSIVLAAYAQSTDSASSAAPVLTAEKIYHVVVDQSPYLVESTSTITWTQSSSIYSPVPTTIPPIPASTSYVN
ncbi:hypothetical protein BDQ17DRAFT_1377580 [Cyathus striatus]|nr:hypothetical protein BDQ17DRAFT_1377580 [Cyathus striatus]